MISNMRGKLKEIGLWTYDFIKVNKQFINLIFKRKRNGIFTWEEKNSKNLDLEERRQDKRIQRVPC